MTKPPDSADLVQDAFEQGHEGDIGEDKPVLSVIEDIDQLLLEQSRVDRVAHRAYARDAVIKLEMAIAVPRQGGDPVALVDAQGLQHVGQLLDPGVAITPGIAVCRPLSGQRDDFHVPVAALCVLNHRRNQ